MRDIRDDLQDRANQLAEPPVPNPANSAAPQDSPSVRRPAWLEQSMAKSADQNQMRDIRGDLQERAKMLDEQIKAAQDQFDGLIEQLKQEHAGKVEDLRAELDAVKLLMGFEHRRLGSATPSAQPQPQPPRSQAQSASSRAHVGCENADCRNRCLHNDGERPALFCRPMSRWENGIPEGEMISEHAADKAAWLMSEFAMKTGLSPTKEEQRRYLWTDAFAVCNFLELYERTGDEQYRHRATELIDQVHRVLGRYRDDDIRSGWISGLDEQAGRRHPTAGGLRIGKPLKERSANEPLDERREWDRDGQYFHYLTKWIHALCQTAFALGDLGYAQWAVELGKAAFKGFARRSEAGAVVGIYWKMSTDLSRPLVPAIGLHDALDGFITFREAQHALAKLSTDAAVADLSLAIESLSALCQHRNWTTDDPLGLGGLLFDAGRLCQSRQ